IQMGIINVPGDYTGLSVGVWNVSDEYSGVMLGLFNYADELHDGVQVGLINIHEHGRIPVTIGFNM
ncbi:MAG: hypothetical protein KDK39_14530, partial [Leptospiraceae bacterium]|nr:hypothetical protein [Leptospiraceae bacterium]